MVSKTTGIDTATFGASPECCSKSVEDDGSNRLASDNERRTRTRSPSYMAGAFPADSFGDSDHQVKARYRAMPVRTPPTEAKATGTVTRRSPRPSGLKQSTIGSAPQILQTLPARDNTASRRGSRRHASLGQTRLSSTKSPQISHEGNQLQMAGSLDLPSTKRRRRSDQDLLTGAQVAPQGSSRARPALRHFGSPSSKSVLPFEDPSPFGNPNDTSHATAPGIRSGQSHEEARSSARSSDAASEDASDLSDPRFQIPFPIIDPDFEPYHEESISAVGVAHEVFDTMRAALSEKIKSDPLEDVGYIYIFSQVERPGFVKIGRTKNLITGPKGRKRQIQRCFKYHLKIISDAGYSSIENHSKVERLVHLELRNYRRRFPCPCRRIRHDGNAQDGLTNHGEWFEISPKKAIEVVTRWKKWMGMEPYLGGVLVRREKVRIDLYRKKKDMVHRNEKDWRWDLFLEDTHLQRCRLWLQGNFLGAREKSTCSPCGSLWKHWKSNVIFILGFFLVSCLLSVTSEFVDFPSAFAPSSAILHTLILGTGAILYAA